MAIRELDLRPPKVPLPPEVTGFIAAAHRAMDSYDDAHPYREKPNFVHCDPELLYPVLAEVTRRELTYGRVFCELGSGFGMGVCLASMLGYRAYGIEIDPDVVRFSRELARSQGLNVEILETSYFPEGFSSYPGEGGDGLIHPQGYPLDGSPPRHWPRYEGMDHDTDEIDVFFVYPWPKEHELFQELFHAVASDGAVLVAYYGDGEICAYQKRMPED
ncbi:MAG TPA: hypothetical protein DCY13_05310 [Verrucomicrobiales bacterium]|nr:hypothetical protein [Verrucomicrobiales bacterium]